MDVFYHRSYMEPGFLCVPACVGSKKSLSHHICISPQWEVTLPLVRVNLSYQLLFISNHTLTLNHTVRQVPRDPKQYLAAVDLGKAGFFSSSDYLKKKRVLDPISCILMLFYIS